MLQTTWHHSAVLMAVIAGFRYEHSGTTYRWHSYIMTPSPALHAELPAEPAVASGEGCTLANAAVPAVHWPHLHGNASRGVLNPLHSAGAVHAFCFCGTCCVILTASAPAPQKTFNHLACNTAAFKPALTAIPFCHWAPWPPPVPFLTSSLSTRQTVLPFPTRH